MSLTTKQLSSNGILIKGMDTVTGKELISLITNIYEDTETYTANDFGFNDFSEITKLDITTEQITKIAKLNLQYHRVNPEYRIVTYTTSDLVFGLSRMWTSYLGSEGPRTYLARDKDKAVEWLSAELDREITLS